MILRRIKPDILHTLIPVCNVMGALAGKLAGVEVIVCSRLSLGNYRDHNKVFAALEDLTDRFFTLIHCKSEGIRDDIMRREPVDPDRLKVIYNGIKTGSYGLPFDKQPLREALGLTLTSPIVGMVANLKLYKGYQDMIKAVPGVLQKHPGTRFLLIGRDDGIQGELMAMAQSLGIAGTIVFAGERHDVPKLLQLMTLLVSASYEEGFSNTILEAMASGLPVVATRVGGNLEQVLDGITGYLVSPGCPDELSAAINQLLDDPAAAQKMGRHGSLRIAHNFSHKAVSEQMVDFYKDAIDLACDR
jgi:glycosyltransferase involved in cell wall biosynthesis